MSEDANAPPCFDAAFRAQLSALIAWRRDVRRFKTSPVPQALVDELLDLAQLSPSVGNSQPWRWMRVDSPDKRAAIRANFVAANEAERQTHADERAMLYASLKLAGLDRAPLQFAVFCDATTAQGFGLGRLSMPQTLDYSTIAMIATFGLAARAAGLGLGWVSILDPAQVGPALGAPPSWRFIAYLCVGWPEEDHLDPELERYGWQARASVARRVTTV